MRQLRNDILVFVIGLLAMVLASSISRADEAELRAIISKFAAAKNFAEIESVAGELAATGDPAVARTLEALADGKLQFRKSDRAVFVVAGSGANLQLADPLTGDPAGEAAKATLEKIKVNNNLRRVARDLIGGLQLSAGDPKVRLTAAETLIANPDAARLGAIETAMERESDAGVREKLAEARAAAILVSDLPDAAKLEVIDQIAARGTREALSLLSRIAANAQGELKQSVDGAIARIEAGLQWWEVSQNVWYGISLGSVLLLAAIGLAITFGVMGVINMAHGEMVMIGAYTTFTVQEVIRNTSPGLLDWSLAIALPMAFCVSGLVGIVLERGVIRFLYGRPLETLLATWGVSLILQQAVRTIFGPTNREVANPSFMSGAFEFGQMSITWNRMYIVLFALAVFFALRVVLTRTPFGLQMRAVTQNRRMASAMGIRTPWVDALTFGLGSGIAGIAGVALSQIDNVSPNLGQSYIIDSFMVVVFGGVGNLWGTLIGALSLGVVNKFMEPYAGAVLGKILVLVFIILFIQKRPRGLFALKGRAVEA
jgi:urea transport system permease protein